MILWNSGITRTDHSAPVSGEGGGLWETLVSLSILFSLNFLCVLTSSAVSVTYSLCITLCGVWQTSIRVW